MRDIGKSIRLLRMKRNMTQDELAEKLFVSRQTVSNYETGRSRPDIEMLVRIAEILETEVQELLYGTQPPPPRTAEVRRLIVAACVVALLAVLCGVVAHFCDFRKGWHFLLSAAECLRLLLRPTMFLLMGWTAMETLSLLPKTRIRPYHLLYARYATVAIIVVYFLMAFIFCGGVFWMDWSSWRYALSGSNEGFSASFSFPGMILFVRFVRKLNRNLWMVFVPLGMLLWLTGGKLRREPLKEEADR